MMKNILFILLLLSTQMSFAQIKATILDSETKEAVPFVNIWVEGKNIGTTSDETGAFELQLDSTGTIIFSAVGYETLQISSDSIENTVFLKGYVNELSEVIVQSQRETVKKVLGKFKKRKINLYYGCNTPWIIARKFMYEKAFDQTPFLNDIKLCTMSGIKAATFNIKIYGVNEDGSPGDYLHHQNIIGKTKKGKKYTKVDLSTLNIRFPENGVFIAVEWLVIPENRHEVEATMTETGEKKQFTIYTPNFGRIPTSTKGTCWIYSKGKWTENTDKEQKRRFFKWYANQYTTLGMELTLTN